MEKVFSLEEAKLKGPPSCLTPRMKNYAGQQGNRLRALYFTEKINKRTYGVFKCECGAYVKSRVDQVQLGLKSSKGTFSCGCLHKEKAQYQQKQLSKNNIKDLTGQKSGTGTAIKRLEEKNCSGNYYGLCKCENGHFHKIDTGNGGKTKICKQCKENMSLGEKAIQKILTTLNVNIKQEYSFLDCRNPKTGCLLRFDFYLPDYNCCIEYDGIQHFKKTNFSHDNLRDRQKLDKIKNQYCQNNNIALIRIPYTDLDMIDEQYIIDKLKKYNIILKKD